MTDDRQQTLTRCQKTGKGCIGPQSLYGIQSLRLRLPDPNRNAFSFPAALFQIKDSRKLLITPHIAWAGIEARIRLMDIILNQIKDFFEL